MEQQCFEMKGKGKRSGEIDGRFEEKCKEGLQGRDGGS